VRSEQADRAPLRLAAVAIAASSRTHTKLRSP